MNYLSKQFFTFSKIPLLFLFIDIFAMRYWGMRWAARLMEKIIFFLNLIKQKWIESVLCAWPILWAAGNTFRPIRAPPSCSPATVTTPALHPLCYHQCRLVGLSDLRNILSPTRYRSEVTPPNMKACGKSQRITTRDISLLQRIQGSHLHCMNLDPQGMAKISCLAVCVMLFGSPFGVHHWVYVSECDDL